jgi:spoIIIJ-associated protein
VYDATNEPHEFVAERREQAIEQACEFFGVARDELRISEPGGVYGLANRVAIVAVLHSRRAPPPDRGGPRGPRERGGSRGERRPGRDRGSGRGRRGEGRGEGRSRRERGGDEVDTSPVPEATEPSVGTMMGSLGDVGRFVCGVVERMALGPFEIGESDEDGMLVIQLRGGAARSLSGSDGRAGDALQLLANQAAVRADEEAPRVVVDVEGDSDAREHRLATLAERVARRARESGRPVKLDAMNGRDRRLIHLALRDEADIATMSTGTGRYRQVVVVPEGAPEFEEARREAEAAAQSAD